MLTSDERDFLLSLPDSELAAWLSKAPPLMQQQILQQLAEHEPTASPAGLAMYCPHQPWAKQKLFLELDAKEVIYGGAAGGGKSDAILMAALQYAHVPGYSALILRKDSQRLWLSGGLIPRSQQWLAQSGATWNGTQKLWTFPSGARLQFGYLQTSTDRYRYASSEFQFIGWDELTDFGSEEDYLFLFSRLRKTRDIPAPYRVRAASNPGGPGHAWVKKRFITADAENDNKTGNLKDVYWADNGAAFVPAKIRDNPAVDPEKYEANLAHVAPLDRARLMNGDWSIMPDGLIKSGWLRYYTMTGQIINLIGQDGRAFLSCDERECWRFITIDTAGCGKDKDAEAKGKPKSWSVAAVWDLFPGKFAGGPWLCLRHVWRDRVGFTELCRDIRELQKGWGASRLYVEEATMGIPLQDTLRREMRIETVGTGGKDKVTRATDLLNMLDRGQVFLPQNENSWRSALEAEWLSWQGLDTDVADQVDVSAYAAMEAMSRGGNTLTLPIDPRRR